MDRLVCILRTECAVHLCKLPDVSGELLPSAFGSHLPQWWRLKNEARRGRLVGVDALGDPSCANMKQKPCGFREAPAWRARRENGSVFDPRLYPSPPKCGRRFGFAENGDSRVSCFTAPKGARDILRTLRFTDFEADCSLSPCEPYRSKNGIHFCPRLSFRGGWNESHSSYFIAPKGV